MDECHGLLVTHADGRVECLDDDCVSFDRPRHEWPASCADVPALCDCSVPAQQADADRQRAA
jgi:hypothetical protein